MGKRLARLIFYGAAGILWLIVIAAGLELYAYWRTSQAEAAAMAHCEAKMQAAFEADRAIIEATAPSAPKPPAHLVRNPPPRAQFFDAAETARQELAEARQELIVRCDAAGRIEQLYVPSQPPELVRLGGLLEAGASVTAPLGEAETTDALRALQDAPTQDFSAPHEYTLALPDGDFYSEWAFVPMGDSQEERLAVFIRPSMWEVPWERFRGGMYAENFYDRWDDSTFWTNSLGYRDSPVAIPKPAGVYRIVCIGGSTTVEGPRNDLTYPNLLEKLLREHFATDRIEVVNCGVYTLDTGRELKQFPEYLALEPDLIIQYNFVNDIAAFYPGWITPSGFLEEPVLSLKALLRRSRFVERYCHTLAMPSEGVLRRHIDNTLIRNLRGMYEQAQAAGVPMAFCSFAYPHGPKVDHREMDFFYFRSNRLWGWSLHTQSYVRLVRIYNDLLETWCREQGALYVPVAEHVSGGVGTFTDICHMHLSGMQKKARTVFESIQELVRRRFASPG